MSDDIASVRDAVNKTYTTTQKLNELAKTMYEASKYRDDIINATARGGFSSISIQATGNGNVSFSLYGYEYADKKGMEKLNSLLCEIMGARILKAQEEIATLSKDLHTP